MTQAGAKQVHQPGASEQQVGAEDLAGGVPNRREIRNGSRRTRATIMGACTPLARSRSISLYACSSVSWLWWPGFTGRATASVSVGELRLAPRAGLWSWS